MTEVRSTSSTGGEKGVKAERYDLLPKEGLDAIARVFGFGAVKYADHNWRKGYEWGKSYSALMRHMTAFWSGETYDPESGLPHLAHAGFHVLVLLTWLEQDGVGSQFDDRYVPDGEVLEPDPNFAEVAEAILAAGPPGLGNAQDLTKDGPGDDEDAPPAPRVKDLSKELGPGVPPAVLDEALRPSVPPNGIKIEDPLERPRPLEIHFTGPSIDPEVIQHQIQEAFNRRARHLGY